MANYENEMREVADWLKHPNELGKAPFKMEFVKDLLTNLNMFVAVTVMFFPLVIPPKIILCNKAYIIMIRYFT